MTDRPESKKPASAPAKKPKIVQFATDPTGYITTVLYNDGRIFIWNWTRHPDSFAPNPYGEGTWGELEYPPLTK
jgi:hypothetical protein